ncbi:MAG TPA: DegQ family serine endoprotease [Candidatus Dormibacteraeota bacterium]|nr:DegQ family serine endoprotease [Candidatus Dormibacteraeota bacterium]
MLQICNTAERLWKERWGLLIKDSSTYSKFKMKDKPSMKRMYNSMAARLSALALGAALLAGSAVAFTQKEKAPAVNVPVDERPIAREVGNHNSYAPIVKKVTPAVVKVYTSTKVHNTSFNAPQGMDDFLRRFFGDDSQGRMPRRDGAVPRQQGIGSGVIVSKEGYILTNNHVVDGADELKVSLTDGREFTAKVIGRDPKSDLAVIKIDAKDLPTVPVADSDKVEVGDVVLAVGNPFGIGQTVTSGIVSATDRHGAIGLDYEDFIQTDAAINPGNSGGALVDSEGRLIGINTAILSRSGGNQGIGFAIPSNLARDVMTSLVRDGKVTRGYLGVMIQDVTPSLAKEFNLKDNSGALVGDVTSDSPAQKAGLKSGDVITEFNGKKVRDSRQLKLEVARVQPGETVPVKVLRDGSTRSLEVSVAEIPGTERLAKNDNSGDKQDNGTLNGVTVGDLDSQSRHQFELPQNVRGVVITEVDPSSPAAEAGLKPGDVIQEINRKPVKSAEEAVKLTEKTGEKVTLLRVWSKGGSHYVVVDESKAG